LDVQLQSYVSDEADRIRDRARRLGELQKTVHQLSDYLRLYERLDAARMSEGDLVRRESELQTLLQQKELDRGAADERLQSLNREFAHWVEAFGTPRFEGEPRAAVDPETYLPILNGRRFANLSSGGLKVLTNLAYALAHHTNALRLDIPLPGILLIDGISTSTIGLA
jgi:DNA repair exonuclease SbcCD ATPase subunit